MPCCCVTCRLRTPIVWWHSGRSARTGFVESFLFSVTPHDPVVFATAGAVLLFAGLLAALIPAIRAARVDPMIALRTD